MCPSVSEAFSVTNFFGFVLIWKLSVKALASHTQNVLIFTRMRLQSYIESPTLKMAYHDESAWGKAGQPSRVLQDRLYLYIGNVHTGGNATPWEPFNLLFSLQTPAEIPWSLQACPLSHNHTAGFIRHLFITSIITLLLLCMRQCAGPLRHTSKQNTDSWPPSLWLLTDLG